MKDALLKATCIALACAIVSAAHVVQAETMYRPSASDGFQLCPKGSGDEQCGQEQPGRRYIVRLSQKGYRSNADSAQISKRSESIRVERLDNEFYSVSAPSVEEDDLIGEVFGKGYTGTVEEDYKRYKAAGVDTAAEGDYLNWGISYSGFDSIMKRAFYDANEEVVVAVLDTGIWKEHPVFQGRLVEGYDFFDEDQDVSDTDGHGTHVAGIVASATDGMPVKIMPLRVMDSSGGYDSVIGQGIRYAADNGADVINMSFTGKGSSLYLEDAVEYAVSKGAVVIAAAGNNSRDTSMYYPAGIDACITVSAVDESDDIAKFSNFGSEVNVAAPGVQIRSSTAIDCDNDGVRDGYTVMSGTSMSAPFVAAAAAAIKLSDKRLLPYETEFLIDRNTRDCAQSGWDARYGEGIIDYKNWATFENAQISGRNELVNGVRTIFESSSFLVKYKAQAGYRPGITVEKDGAVLPASVTYPDDGYALIVMDGSLPSGSVNVNIDGLSFEAVVEDEQGEFAFTPESEIVIELPSGVLGGVSGSDIYIRSPGGERVFFESLELENGSIKAIPGSSAAFVDGRCSIVMDRLRTDAGTISEIIPSRIYRSGSGG